VFFDIETYSPGEKPTRNDKVIAIAYKPEGGEIVVLKEWEDGEKRVLVRFLEGLSSIDWLSLIGHNILRFDIPVIVNRVALHEIAPPHEVGDFLFDSFPIDTTQTQLPSNNWRFKGLGLRDCASKIGYTMNACPSSEIMRLYDSGKPEDYDAIIKHVIEDVEVTEKLFRQLYNQGRTL
jgi:hypothetical protein